MTPIFEPFPKIARISRECYVTEKIDGTNASILIMSGSADTENVIHSWYSEEDECEMILLAGSRNRWITPQNDNAGFAKWAKEHAEELQQLGPGRHHGEWWGCLSAETSVRLADGSLEKIGKIVNQKLTPEVLSYNFDTGAVEAKRIIGHSKGAASAEWITLGFARKHRGGKQPHINLTPNHVLYRQSSNLEPEEVSAGDIRVGDRVFLNAENPGHLQQQLIAGSILGDGSIDSHSFHVSHSNHAYLDTKIKILGTLVSNVSFAISGKGAEMKRLSTKSLPFIRDIESALYSLGKKDINAGFMDFIGPAALAFWYADDGHIETSSIRRSTCCLCTRGFSVAATKQAAAKLSARGYDNYVFLADGQPVIKFTPEGTRRLHMDISPFMPWEMKYKILPELRGIVPIWEQSSLITDDAKNLVPTKVTSITDDYAKSKRSKVRYDIEVEGNHNFFANGILVHNSGIQRNYGLKEKRWSLFNVGRWCQHGEDPGIIATADPRFIQRQDVAPPCCHVVPLLYRGEFCTVEVDMAIVDLEREGSYAAPGFMKAEGVIVYHVAAGISFKKTLEKDEQPKGRA